MNHSSLPDVCLAQQSLVVTIDVIGKNFWGLFPLVYGLPSVLLDIYITSFLLSKKGQEEFRTVFYILFAISSIVEISEWIAYNCVQRLPSVPAISFLFAWIPKDGIVVSILYFIACYTGYLVHVPSFLFTINRFTSVVFPVNHEENWRKWIKTIMIVYFLYPLVFSWQYLFMDQVRHCQIWDAATTVSYHIFILHRPSYGIPLYFSVMIISFFFCASCLILNITTMILLVYRRKHRNSNNIADQKSARIELNMFILTLLIFLTSLLWAYCRLFSPLTSPIQANILVILPFVTDMICLTPPWMLIIMSKKLRKKILGRFLNKNESIAIQVQGAVQVPNH